jgi:HEAT repeat protein
MMTPPFDGILSWAVPKVLNLGWDRVHFWWTRRNGRKKFVELFLQELRDRGVENEQIKQKKYHKYLGKLVSDPDVKELLAKSFESNFVFERTKIDRIEQIWTQQYQPSGVPFPADFNWDLLIERYQEALMELRKRDEKEQKVLELEATEANTKAQKLTAPIPVGFDIPKYRESLNTSYGYLKLNTLDTTDSQYRIQLGKMFIEQNVREALPPSRFEIPQHYKQNFFKSGKLDLDLNPEQAEQYRRQYLESSAEPVLAAICNEKCQRAVVLGDPGSGKSTLLQYLALDWAEGKTERFPLLIELREYVNDRSPAKTFLDFLERGARADWKFDRHKLHKYLLTQPSLVMFDGLDEVFDLDNYQAVVDEIANFANQQYPKAKIIVTSRVIKYNSEQLRDAKFQHFTLQELDRSQIEEFIDKWYQLAMGEDSAQELLKQRLNDAIDNSPAIANLAGNPILLTMMAILNRRQDLPKERAELYDQASRIFLHNWDVDHKKLNLPLDKIGRQEKQEILRKIAYEMQSDEKGLALNLIDSGRLKAILTDYLKREGFGNPRETADGLIDQLRSRNYILCDRGRDAYGFVHRTFLEYFCAREIVHQFKEEQSLSIEQLRDDIFGQHWQDRAWHEVLRLICGLLLPKWAGQLVDFLMVREVDRSDYLDDDNCAKEEAFQHLQLAIECFAEIRNPQSISSIAAKLREKLKNEIESQSKILLSYEAALSLFNSIGQYYQTESETLTWLQNFAALHDQDGGVRQAAIWSIGEYYQTEETLTWLQNFAALHVQDEGVRRVTVKSIGKYHETEETLTWLQNFAALHEQKEWVRQAAVESIGQYYQTEETLTWLQNFAALHDQDEWVRRAAVESIGEYYCHTNPETLTWLQNFAALHDQDGGVRRAAVESIAEYYHTESDTLTWLQDFATTPDDQDGGVRRAAIQSSFSGYHYTEPDVPTLIQNLTFHIEENIHRWAAVESIAKYYQTDPETLTWLQNVVALHDEDLVLQFAAVKSIAEYYQAEPETLPWLQNVAFHDQNGWSVRSLAMQLIAEYYQAEPETLPWLQNALHDQDMVLRVFAVQSIGQYYQTEPETLTCLQKVALHDENGRVRLIAVQSIAEYYIQADGVFELLCQIASQDPSPEIGYFNPRKTALKALVEHYIDRPEVIELLRDRSTQDPDEELRKWAKEQLKNIV